MNTILNQKTLIDTEIKRRQLVCLILLRQATRTLENKDWYTVPYAGQNYIQEILFQAKLISDNVWDNFFRNNSDLFKNKIKLLEDKIVEIENINS